MQETSIEWADYSANPLKYRDKDDKVVWACVKHSAGCAHCYAEALALRFGRGGPFTKEELRKVEPFLDAKELRYLLKSQKIIGNKVFIGDMTDVFGDWVPDEMLDRLFAVFALRPDVTFQVLTKRAERLQEYLAWHRGGTVYRQAFDYGYSAALNPLVVNGEVEPWPLPNVWLGVSVENQAAADQRIPLLLQTPAAVRFLSCEPLLGLVDLKRRWLTIASEGQWLNVVECGHRPESQHINWVIVGGESGHGARPCRVEWIRSIVKQCKAAGVSCFVKQLGSRPEGDDIPEDDRDPVTGNRILHVHEVLTIRDRKGGDIEEWSEDLRVRQFPEMPA